MPIETSVKALTELVAEGKTGGIGLSEVSAATIRRASTVHKIAAVEIELNLFTPDPLHSGIMNTWTESQYHLILNNLTRRVLIVMVSWHSCRGIQSCWKRSPHRHVPHALRHPSKRLSTHARALQAGSIRTECEAG